MKGILKYNSIMYLLAISLFGTSLFFIIDSGKKLENTKNATGHHIAEPLNTAPPESPGAATEGFPVNKGHVRTWLHGIGENLNHPLSRLILQIIIIASFARLFAILSGKIGQPKVVGEIIAGIVIGPSLLGMFFPSIYQFVFPASSMGILQMMSQIGLVIFMFLIGMELDLKIIRKKAHEAMLISHSSIMLPFLLGVILAWFLYLESSPAGVSFTAFSLFMGIAMSITAFPVLARIIQERGLTRTPMGTMALTCAAADDVTAWLILAAVIAIIKAGNAFGALLTLVLVVGYIITMIYIIQPFLKRMAGIYGSRENLHKSAVAIIFIFILVSAYSTEVIGIHALFGGFLAGAIMPSGFNFKELLQEKLEDFILILLVPLFFAFTGLRTQIGLLNSPHLWYMFFLILAVAVSGKIIGSYIPARLVGMNLRDSMSIGILMNTRGLMELIVLNIGYELGILSPEIFSMMVLMALSTTFMTGPLLGLVDYMTSRKAKKSAISTQAEIPMKILISFGIPDKGPGLLSVANGLKLPGEGKTFFTALHLTPDTDISKREAILYEKQSFNQILGTARKFGIELETIYKVGENIVREILNFGTRKKYDFLLMGGARPLFSNNILGGKIKSILDSQLNAGIYIEKRSKNFNNIIVLTDKNLESKNILDAAERFRLNYGSGITQCKISEIDRIENLEEYDLIITSPEIWEKNTRGTKCWVPPANPSILILKTEDNCFAVH